MIVADYGRWHPLSKIHALDGTHWLCGRKRGLTATFCSENLEDVTCKMCLKKLNQMKDERNGIDV